jgi:epoxyqueuosine reductase
MNLTKLSIANSIELKAKELGFLEVGFSKAEHLGSHANQLTSWLENGYHAQMQYMANHFDKRTNPQRLVEGTKTIISLLHNYYPSQQPTNTDKPKIARYAYGKDYHKVLKKKLKTLYEYIQSDLYPDLNGRYFVDSAPVLERALAYNSGLGWVGKNSNLIHPKHGSYFFISEIFVNFELPYGKPLNDYCGGCTKCIDACPTKAIIAPKTIDANRCISYLTIENKEEIDTQFSGLFQNWVFGCDICQEVCPWNRKAQPHSEPAFEPNEKFLSMTNDDWMQLTEDEYNEQFLGSPLMRTKYEGMMRNVRFVASSAQ